MSEKIIEEKVETSEENEETSDETNEEINEGTKEEKKFDKYEECILTKIIDDKTYYQCKLCNFISDLKSTLKKHLDKKKKCYNIDQKKCKYCRIIFSNKKVLENHLNKKKKSYYKSDPKKIKKKNNKDLKIKKLELNE